MPLTLVEFFLVYKIYFSFGQNMIEKDLAFLYTLMYWGANIHAYLEQT